MYPTDSMSPAFLILFLLLLPVSGHLPRGFTVTPTKAYLLCANPQARTECSPLDFRRSSIARCKGEQNYGGVALFVRTCICSVQDQVTVSATNFYLYTKSNISYVICYTCACDVNKYGVIGEISSFVKVTMRIVQSL